MNKDEIINRIALHEGIIDEYYDVWGNKRTASIEVKEALLGCLGYPVENTVELKETFDEILHTEASGVLEPVYFTGQESDVKVSFKLSDGHPLNRPVEISLLLDNELLFKKSLIPSECELKCRWQGPEGVFNEFQVAIPCPPEIGYYDIRLDTSSHRYEAKLIVYPRKAYIPEALQHGRLWGLGANLFEINSSNNQGIGDLTDLKALINWVGSALGGDFLAINPLHSTTNQYPSGISPYAPLSRLYLNPIYIDIGSVQDAEPLNSSTVKKIQELKKKEFIDYEAIYALKCRALKECFEGFYERHYLNHTKRAEQFRKYLREEGKLLHEYALFMALYEHFATEGLYGWTEWPLGFRHPEDPEVKEFEKAREKEILYYKYLQWLLDLELREVRQQAIDAGMAVGIYRDMAIGSLSGGADVWSNQDIFVNGCSVGAPPDTFSPLGQNWGFPPIAPSRLRKRGYDFFINLIRKNLSHAGALRIDHALGLFRLFCIPEGFPAEMGLYIRYPAEELLSIIALESVKQKAVIVAEDLGTVPHEVREMLYHYGMFSFRLLYFEKDYSTGEYLPPSAYPEMAIVSTTTHDLPTIYGFWEGHDIKIKEELNRYPDREALQQDIRERQYDRWRLLRALNNEGLLPDGIGLEPDKIPQMTEPLCIAIYRYLAKTPSKLLMVNLNDITGIKEQTNLPGTLTEYPNWQRKHHIILEDIMKKPFEWLKGLR